MRLYSDSHVTCAEPAMPGDRTATKHREVPAYPIAEAARYLGLAPATLRSWVKGREYPTRKGSGHFTPLIRLPEPRQPLLSFNNLVEAHVLKSLRRDHSVSIGAVREALQYAQRTCRVPRLLLSPELRAHAGELFLDRYGALLSLTPSGQYALRKVLESYLQRVVWDQALPRRLYPFVRGDSADAPRDIVIDPELAFGRPVVERRGISTSAIVQRFDAGETAEAIATDYELTPKEVEEAVLYERAA